MANPTYDQVNGDYQKYLGRTASQDEYDKYWASVGDYTSDYIKNSPEAGGYATGQASNTPPPTDPNANTSTTTPTYGAVNGFNIDKINDPTHVNDKYTPALRAFSSYLGSGGQITRGGLDSAVNYFKSNGFPNASVAGDDKIDFGDGNGPIDVVMQDGTVWFQNGQDRFGGGAAGAAGGASGGGGAAAPAPGSGTGGWGDASASSQSTSSTVAPYAPDPRLTALYNQLLARSTQSLNVDANDPLIKSQVDPARVAGQRALLLNEQQAAERGGPYATGALNNNARMGAESLANNLSTLTGTLIGNEVAARRSEIAQALSGQFGILSLEQQSALRNEDQQLQSRQLDLQDQQQTWMRAFQEKGFTADQAYRMWQEAYQQQQADRTQANATWEQTWKTSGGGA